MSLHLEDPTKTVNYKKKASHQYVVTYDNGSGYIEWACPPQDSREAAWGATSLKPGMLDAKLEFFIGFDDRGNPLTSKSVQTDECHYCGAIMGELMAHGELKSWRIGGYNCSACGCN
jgi:hypothetical protein